MGSRRRRDCPEREADKRIANGPLKLEEALSIAQAFSEQGWSLWWARDISMGKRFHNVVDEVDR